MNRVLLMGRLTRDPELRTTAGGKAVAAFTIATNEYVAGSEKTEFHNVIAWERLAETCARYLGKGSQVLVEGRLATRSWDSSVGRHWKTEVVVVNVQMFGRRAVPIAPAGDDLPGDAAPELDEVEREAAEAFA